VLLAPTVRGLDMTVMKRRNMLSTRVCDVQVVVPMKLFPVEALTRAQRNHAINRTGNLESRVNTNRGKGGCQDPNSLLADFSNLSCA
jgi:hypothetical protein